MCDSGRGGRAEAQRSGPEGGGSVRARSLMSMVVLAVLVAAAGCSGKGSGAGSGTTAAPTTSAGTDAQTTAPGGTATTAPGASTTTGPNPSTSPTSSAAATSAPGSSTTARPPTTSASTTSPTQADAAALAFLERFDTDQELRTEVLGATRAALAPGGTADQLTTIQPGLRTASYVVVAGTSGPSVGETDAGWKVVQTLAGFWGVQGGFRNEGGQARVGLRLVMNGITIDTPYDVMVAVADGRFGQAEWVATTHGE